MRPLLAPFLAILALAACSSAPGASSTGTGGATGASSTSTTTTGSTSSSTTTTSSTGTTGSGGAGGGTGASTTGSGAGGGGGAAPVETRGMWVWQKAVVTDPAEEAKLFAFCAARKINTVFVESQSLIGNAQPALAAFIAAADAKGIAVELLFGNTSWALPAGHAKAEGLAQAAVTFSAGLGAAPRPIGVHFDVEPYTLPEWTSDQAGTAGSYLDLLASLQQKTAGSGLRLSADIAFWFDGIMVSRQGQARPLSEWVIDSVDRAVLMDYRDTAAQIEAQSATEIAYGASKARPVLLGVETLCNLDPPSITFCEEGVAALDLALQETQAHYAMSPGFAGFAVHDYVAYGALGP